MKQFRKVKLCCKLYILFSETKLKINFFFPPDIENFREVGSGWRVFVFIFFSVTCAVWAYRPREHGAKNGFSFPDAFETSPAAVQGRSLAAPAPSECPPLNGAC